MVVGKTPDGRHSPRPPSLLCFQGLRPEDLRWFLSSSSSFLWMAALPSHSPLLGLGPSCRCWCLQRPRRCKWRQDPVGSSREAQTSLHCSVTLLKNDLTLDFLCLQMKKETQPPPNGRRDWQSKLSLCEGTWLLVDLAGLMIGIDDFRGLFKPK